MATSIETPAHSAVLEPDLRNETLVVVRGKGNYFTLDSGRTIFDACGGSAVACLGTGDERVEAAVQAQMRRLNYAHHTFTSDINEELARTVIASTGNKMARFLTLTSGSESVDAALKMARQYFLELPEPQPERTRFIGRLPSYHGATLGALAVGGNRARRQPFTPLLDDNITPKVSPCNAYRFQRKGESTAQYVERLAAELDEVFRQVGPHTVCAFVAETVAGASIGCVPPVEGYFQAMEAVCRKHGALLILDEVMCGMGRTGTMHAWQQEGVVPNIQVVGKAFGAGYVPISGVLIDHEVAATLTKGSGKLSHGQSFQSHPVSSAAALEVQRIIAKDGLLQNVLMMGDLLSSGLRRVVGDHPNVGNIRGRGLFWALEFVKDKASGAPFPPEMDVGHNIRKFAYQDPYALSVYAGSGCIDGVYGDYIALAPAYNITAQDVDIICEKVRLTVTDFFAQQRPQLSSRL